MDQNMNQNQNQNPVAGERTFTQEDVNRIVGERLAKEKGKQDAAFAEQEAAFAEREKELARREALVEVKDQLKDMGLPSELLPVLNVQDKEALNKALEALQEYIDKKVIDKNKLKVLPNRLPKGSYESNGSVGDLRKAMLYHEE